MREVGDQLAAVGLAVALLQKQVPDLGAHGLEGAEDPGQLQDLVAGNGSVEVARAHREGRGFDAAQGAREPQYEIDAGRSVGREENEGHDEEELPSERWMPLGVRRAEDEDGSRDGGCAHEIQLEEHVRMRLGLGERLVGPGRPEGRKAIDIVLSQAHRAICDVVAQTEDDAEGRGLRGERLEIVRIDEALGTFEKGRVEPPEDEGDGAYAPARRGRGREQSRDRARLAAVVARNDFVVAREQRERYDGRSREQREHEVADGAGLLPHLEYNSTDELIPRPRLALLFY